jgi:hypothetical protein
MECAGEGVGPAGPAARVGGVCGHAIRLRGELQGDDGWNQVERACMGLGGGGVPGRKVGCEPGSAPRAARRSVTC